MAKIYVHELSSFGTPHLERYSLLGRDDYFLDEIELEEKMIRHLIEKIHQDSIKKGYGHIQEKIKEICQNLSQAVISGRCRLKVEKFC